LRRLADVTDVTTAPPEGGRLMRLLAARGGTATGEPTMVLQHREALIWTLGKAAALEQLVMCQYLYAAFALKDRDDDGLTPAQLEATRRWRRELIHIGEQEMLHLALVQNLLTAVGAGSAFERPNFPLPPHAYPAGIRMELLPFEETSLRHFIYLERPEGLDMADQDALAAVEKAAPLPRADEDEIGPRLQDFDTIGTLYRAIEIGFDRLAAKLGEDRLFVGPRSAQAVVGHFPFPDLVAVTDLASAHAAIETIVEQGEGARGEWRQAHFGRLITVLDEYLDLRDGDPGFEPSRPVLAACVREREDGIPVPLITDPLASRSVDLLNAVYEVILQLLARYFAHTDETEDQLDVLADVSVGLMRLVVKPLGGLVTRLPVGPEHPGRTAGPTFELFYGVDFLLPHREAAWVVMEERMRVLAELGTRCKEVCSPMHLPTLEKITGSLLDLADQLAEAR
jgi:ferritin-like protein